MKNSQLNEMRNKMNDNYCNNCGKKVPIWIRYKTVNLKYATRKVTYDELYAVCQFCGEKVYDPKVENMNIQRQVYARSGLHETIDN